jgi:hypothetical protein
LRSTSLQRMGRHGQRAQSENRSGKSHGSPRLGADGVQLLDRQAPVRRGKNSKQHRTSKPINRVNSTRPSNFARILHFLPQGRGDRIGEAGQ